ncbi:MAG: AraC family transcriptional regulator [Blautia sp.]|nr:AraC family transcriptional regulator [Lachnoclostridium sp.]MCM1212523.1 AraC family transcriptional regulator [Blautia sp.]
MEWMEVIREAVRYVEKHITEDITMYDVAEYVHVSPFYFHKGFSILCGYSITEYIRNRRLALAGQELLAEDSTIMELAMKYGYDSPDSFTKAFTRFHGHSPSVVRKDKTMLKAFAPLKLTISLKGGYAMDYRITKKEAFTVLAVSREFSCQNAKQDIPAFWEEHYASGNREMVCGMFGICGMAGINSDTQRDDGRFEYLIADVYNPSKDIPEGVKIKTIPALTWAVFPCRGALPQSLQGVNEKIFSEWLPALHGYEFAAEYSVEMYDTPDKYPKGTDDENYYAEIWVPVQKVEE